MKKIEDKDILEFATFCIGCLSHILNLPQEEVYKRLEDSGILHGYIVECYDVLHTFGSKYLMNDLIDFMKEKGVLESDREYKVTTEQILNVESVMYYKEGEKENKKYTKLNYK